MNFLRIFLRAMLILHCARPLLAQPGAQPDRRAAAAMPTGPALAMREYDDGDPTPEEQYLLELLNRARARPEEEGRRLAETDDPTVLLYYKAFGIDPAKLIADFARYPSRPPLALQAQLSAAAREHAADMLAHNYQAHISPDGITFGDRARKYGYEYWNFLGENIYSYALSLWHAHAGMAADWGEENQRDLGHRRNMMNFETPGPICNEVGIGLIHLDNAGDAGRVGPYIIAEIFSENYGARRNYILGVVYRDENNNDFYDVGEGIPGVRITPSSGEYYAVTGASGGYAIPYAAGAGAITLTAEGSGLHDTLALALKDENVKADFVLHDDASPVNRGGEQAAAMARIHGITPNPVTGLSVVRYSLPVAGRVTLRLVDAAGRTFTTFLREDEAPGEHIAYIFSTSVPAVAGVYYLQLETASGSAIEKIVVLR